MHCAHECVTALLRRRQLNAQMWRRSKCASALAVTSVRQLLSSHEKISMAMTPAQVCVLVRQAGRLDASMLMCWWRAANMFEANHTLVIHFSNLLVLHVHHAARNVWSTVGPDGRGAKLPGQCCQVTTPTGVSPALQQRTLSARLPCCLFMRHTHA